MIPEEGNATDKPALLNEPEFEARELDDELRKQIREQLEADRLKVAVEEKMQQAQEMLQICSDKLTLEADKVLDPAAFVEGDDDAVNAEYQKLYVQLQDFREGLRKEVTDWASENGFIFGVTPLMTGYEMLDQSEDYPIVVAAESENSMFNPNAMNVAQQIFSTILSNEYNSNSLELYQPHGAYRQTEVTETKQYYTWFLIDFDIRHIPTLDEDGVRDSVIRAWQAEKAREKVQARGEKLAKMVEEVLSKETEEIPTMESILEGQTQTGEEDSPALEIGHSGSFTWLQPSFGFFQQQQGVELGQIRLENQQNRVLPRIGEDFMKVVFTELKENGVGVVPNLDLSTYYVVHVTDRTRPSEAAFALEGRGNPQRPGSEGFGASPFVRVMQNEIAGPVFRKWQERLLERYDIDQEEWLYLGSPQ